MEILPSIARPEYYNKTKFCIFPIKQRYPEAIVFFRLGDFYETFDDDAKVTSRELGITLTSREMGKGQRVPMAEFSYDTLIF